MRQLADGHWVLAFPDGEKAAAAQKLVQQHAGKLRELYKELLSPLTGSGGVGRAIREVQGVGVSAAQGVQHMGEKGAVVTAGAGAAAAVARKAMALKAELAEDQAAAAAGPSGSQAEDRMGWGESRANHGEEGSRAPYGEAIQLPEADMQQQQQHSERVGSEPQRQQQVFAEEGEWGVLNDDEPHLSVGEGSGWEGGDEEDLLEGLGDGVGDGAMQPLEEQQQQVWEEEGEVVVGEVNVGGDGWNDEYALDLELDAAAPETAVAGAADTTSGGGGVDGAAIEKQPQEQQDSNRHETSACSSSVQQAGIVRGVEEGAYHRQGQHVLDNRDEKLAAPAAGEGHGCSTNLSGSLAGEGLDGPSKQDANVDVQ
jgi:hypothetical protein